MEGRKELQRKASENSFHKLRLIVLEFESNILQGKLPSNQYFERFLFKSVLCEADFILPYFNK